MITFCTQKTVFKKSILGGTKCVNAPIFYTTDVHYKYFTKIITFHYLLLTFLLCLPTLTNCITFRKLLLTFLLPLICYTTGVVKIITPNWNWQQILSCKFSHFCHNMDVYCLYCWVMQIENPLWLFFSSN